jgi:outer membrane protein assembly factor BamB
MSRVSRRYVLRRLAVGVAGLTVLTACQPVEVTTTNLAEQPLPEPTATPEPTAAPTAVRQTLEPTPTLEPVPPQPLPALVGRPMYQMDAQHSGRSSHAGPRDPILRRSFETANFLTRDGSTPTSDIQSSAAIAPDGTIYLANHLGVLFALRDPRRGPSPTTREREAPQLAWRFHPPQESSWHATPALAPDGTVYLAFSEGGNTANAKGTLYALRAPQEGIEGQVMWAVSLGPGRQTSSPTLGPDGTVYVVSGSGWLFALSAAGQVLWTVQTGPALKSAPALSPDGSTVYVASMNGKLFAVAPPGPGSLQASVRWTFEFAQFGGRAPAVVTKAGTPGPAGADGIGTGASPTIGPDGTVYIGANNSNLYAITPNGKLRWMFEAEREIAGIWSTAALSLDGGTLFFGANKGGIYAINTEDGSQQWRFPIVGSVYSSPALGSDDVLYTGSTAGHIIGIGTASGKLIFDYDAKVPVWTAPAIRPDGSLVVADRAGRVLVLADA